MNISHRIGRRHGLSLAVIGVALGAMALQAFGLVDVAHVIRSHPDLALGLAGLGFLGEVDVETELKKISDDVKELGTKAMKAVEKNGTLATELKTQVDTMLVKQGELQGQLLAVQQKQDASASNGWGGPALKTAGQELVESDAFKQYVAEGNWKKAFSFPVKAIVNVTSAADSAGDLIAPDRRPGILAIPQRRLTVRDLITPGQTNSNLIQYVQETGFQNMAAPVAEGAAKPKSDITFDLLAKPVVKLATYVKASSEILMDAPMLQSYINERLRYMLAFVEEGQLLKGSGAGNNLHGIYTQATAYAAPITIAGATRIDLLRLALLQSELAEFPATGIVLHPSDWTAIELQKDSTGAYIFANPQAIASPVLWGRPVVATQAMTQDEFLVGAFRLGAQVFDRMAANIAVATENEDDFIKNMVTILIEERLGLAVYRPEAFVKGDLTPA